VTPLSRPARALIARLAPAAWRESIEGDIHEERTRRQAAGRHAGPLWEVAAAITVSCRLRQAARSEVQVMRHSRFPSPSVLAFELRQAVRALVKRPAFSLITLVTLTLGIGAGTAVFTLSNWLIFRPVPGVSDPDGLVTIRLEFPSGGFYTMSAAEYRAVAATPGLASAGAAADATFYISTGGGGPQRVEGAVVTANYFDVLGQHLTMGRAFGAREEDPGNADVAIVSDAFWRTSLGSDPGAIGRAITINGYRFTVIGVAARGFRGPDRSGHAHIWVPLASFAHSMPSYPATLLTGNVGVFFSILGRRSDGVTTASVGDALKVTQATIAASQPNRRKFKDSALVASAGLAVPDWQREGLRQMFALLLGVSALLLVLTCANVANMFFAHAHERAGELATRQALGASRARVVRQLTLESLLLALGGGAMALAASVAVGRAVDGLVIARTLPALSAIGVDWRVFAFALAVSAVVCLASSLAPALMGSRVDLVTSLKATGRGGMRRSRGVRRLLTFVQVGVAVLLLGVGALLVRSLLARYQVPLGYDAQRVLAFAVDSSVQGYSKERTVTYYRETLNRVRSLPGVSDAGLAYIEPFQMIGGGISLTPVGAADAKSVVGDTNMVTDGFFTTLGVRFLGGRDFRADEIFRADTDGNGVVIVNAAMARALFGTEAVAGRQVIASFPEKRSITIVGVVADIRTRDVGDAPVKPTAYEPFGQSFLSGWGTVHLRLTQPAAAVVPAVRRVMTELDPNLPIGDVELVSDALDRHLAEPRLLAHTIEAFAALATLVAALGIYGVLSRSVEERRREFGIRAALGAQPSRLAALVTREALVLALAGGAAGVLATWALARAIEARLYSVRPADPLSLGSAAAVAVVAALLAAAVPAWRARRVNPVAELR
jgi:predicted permease